MKEVRIVMPETIDEWAEISEYIRRAMPMKGIPTNAFNSCPVCGKLVAEDEPFCGHCGQRVEFVKPNKADPDVVPFEEA